MQAEAQNPSVAVYGLGADDGFVNPCGGMRWRTLEDGRIELEDGTIPAFSPDSESFKNLALTWQNWEDEFREAAAVTGVPEAWLLAIANNETGFLARTPDKQRTVLSSDGFGSIGIMQPLAQNAREFGYHPDDRYDAYLNIEMGGKELRRGAERPNGAAGGFPVVAAMFNGGPGSGGCKPGNDVFNLKGHQGRYATLAIRGLNSAIEHLPVDERVALAGAGPMLWTLALGSVAFAGWALWKARR